jgi:hypothetical protein
MTQQNGRLFAVVGFIFVSSLALTAAQANRPAGAAQAAADPPTFSKDVAPVLYKHCTTCHRPGEAAPMSLLTYESARPWARSIANAVTTGMMPPWQADPAHGHWRNERRLTPQEKDAITRWVAAGAPQGDPKDLPAQPVYAEGWRIGTPDAILTMAEPYTVPASGEIEYQYFEVPTNFTEDKWVQAIEIRPGAREVVHHVLVYARHPEMKPRPAPFRQANPQGGPLPPGLQQQSPEERQRSIRRGPLMAQTAPGTDPTIFPPGSALLVKAGTVLTFQVHYTTAGKAMADTSSIGFVFAKQPVTTEVRTAAMMNPRFMIPAGAENHPVESGLEFTEDVTIYNITPHTHLRGKSWEHRVTYPDGRTEIILSVPKYDFNWQTDYQFVTPLRLPKGSKLQAVAHYDNSKNNKANPDPTKDVYWGDQTWEEMQYTGFNYSVDKDRVTTSNQQQ